MGVLLGELFVYVVLALLFYALLSRRKDRTPQTPHTHTHTHFKL